MPLFHRIIYSEVTISQDDLTILFFIIYALQTFYHLVLLDVLTPVIPVIRFLSEEIRTRACTPPDAAHVFEHLEGGAYHHLIIKVRILRSLKTNPILKLLVIHTKAKISERPNVRYIYFR